MGRFIDVCNLLSDVYNTSYSDRGCNDRFEDLSPAEQMSRTMDFITDDLFEADVEFFFGTRPTQIRRLVVDATSEAVFDGLCSFIQSLIDNEFGKKLPHGKVSYIANKILDDFPTDYYFRIESIGFHLSQGDLKLLLKQNDEDNVKIQQIVDTRKRLQQNPDRSYLALCFKVYERDSTTLLEIGTALYHTNAKNISCRHYIVEEHESVINERYVQNHRDDFCCGRSITLPLEDCLNRLLHVLSLYSENLVLVFFGSHIHLRFLETMTCRNYEETNLQRQILGIIKQVEVFDLMKMHREHSRSTKFSSLQKVAEECEVDDLEDITIGNAGNDALVTMLAFQNFMKI